MDFTRVHDELLLELQSGGRGLRRWTPEQTRQLILALTPDHPELTAVLRLVTLSHVDRAFEAPLSQLLEAPLLSEQWVDLLNAARKHIVQARLKDGDRLEASFIAALERLLKHPDSEVVEWTLRTIEECGHQGIYFRSHLSALRPSVFSLWRARNRTILELITLLERRWKPHAPQKR